MKRGILETFFIRLTIFIFLLTPANSAKDSNELDRILDRVWETKNSKIQANLLRGTLSALDGLKNVKAPAAWKKINHGIMKGSNDELKQLALQLSQIFGDQTALKAALALVLDDRESLSSRKIILNSLLNAQYEDLQYSLKDLLKGPLRREAIRAYGIFDNPDNPRILLSYYGESDDSHRRTIIETLATREKYATSIVTALKKGQIQRKDIPGYVVRNLQKLLGRKFTKVYGEIQQMPRDKTKLIAKYKRLAKSKKFNRANASRGRMIYNRTCAACHVLFGSGGKIGPDLTGSNRPDLDYILLNIIDPNFDVPEGYRMVTIKKKDGQVLVGNIIFEDEGKLVLNMVGNQSTVIKSDIVSRSIAKVSLMPEGLLSTITENEFVDLIKYLQSDHQVEVSSQ